MKSKPVASRSSSVLGGSKREGRIPGRRPGQPGTVRSLAAAPKKTANNNCYDFGGRGLIV
jgi:hypothetical protein